MHYNRKNDFLIADEIMRPGNTWGRAWRDMCDPPSISKHLICFYNRQYICNSHYGFIDYGLQEQLSAPCKVEDNPNRLSQFFLHW